MTIQFRTNAPTVTVVGVTKPIEQGINAYLESRNTIWQTDTTDNPATLSEFGGRICYGKKSFKNVRQSTQAQYLQNSIIDHGHESVLEHVVLNFAVSGLPRTVLTELSRHRHVSMSVRSTRFADDEFEFAIPPHVRHDSVAVDLFQRTCTDAIHSYEKAKEAVRSMVDFAELPKTLQNKREREAARNILPGALTCDMLLTMNVRALRHIVSLRSNEHADESFREFAVALFYAAKSHVPELLQDAKSRWIGTTEEIWFG